MTFAITRVFSSPFYISFIFFLSTTQQRGSKDLSIHIIIYISYIFSLSFSLFFIFLSLNARESTVSIRRQEKRPLTYACAVSLVRPFAGCKTCGEPEHTLLQSENNMLNWLLYPQGRGHMSTASPSPSLPFHTPSPTFPPSPEPPPYPLPTSLPFHTPLPRTTTLVQPASVMTYYGEINSGEIFTST